MKKIIIIILVMLVGLSIIPKTLINEKHIVLESTTSVYTKEEVDSLLSTIRTNITNNTNEITNIKGELTEVQNSLKDYASKTSLNTTNSNIDNLNTVASSNASRITSLETLYSGGNATASQILSGKTAIVGSKQITGTMENKGELNWKPTTSTTYIVPEGYYSGGTLDSSSAYQAGYDAGAATGVSLDPLQLVSGNYVQLGGAYTGSDTIVQGSSPSGGASASLGSSGYRVYYSNSANYGSTSASITTRTFYTLGYKYLKIYIGEYSASTRRAFPGYSITAVSGNAPTLVSGSVASGQTLVYDVSSTESFTLKITAGGDNLYSDGTATAIVAINNIRLTNTN